MMYLFFTNAQADERRRRAEQRRRYREVRSTRRGR